MNLKSYITKITFAAIATMLSGLAAQATPITVPNASFETPTSPSETATNPNLIFGHPNSVSATTGNPTGKVYITSSDNRYMSVIYTDTNTVLTHIPLQGLGLRVLVTAP